MKYLAQKLILPGDVSGTPVPIEIEGPLLTPHPLLGRSISTLGDVINILLPILFAAAGLILFFFLIAGGFDLLLSGGDPKKAESAKGKITNAVVGFIIIFVAWWLTQILSKIFGLGGL